MSQKAIETKVVTKIQTETKVTRTIEIPRDVLFTLLRREFGIPSDHNFSVSTDVYEAGEVGDIRIEYVETTFSVAKL